MLVLRLLAHFGSFRGGNFDGFSLGFAHRFSNPFRPISLAASGESLRLGLFFIMILAASRWIC